MEGTIAPEQIIINGQEFSSEDATRFIDLGKKYSEMESKLNTSLDKVYPEYTKATQRNKELEAQLAARDAEFEKIRKAETVTQVPTDVQAARKAAREIGLLDDEALNEKGYMTKDQIDAYFTEKQSIQQSIESVNAKGAQLEKEIDGSDGRVPFVYEAVLPYASTYKIDDLAEAYERMNARANAKWKEAQLEKEERPGLTTLQPGGKKSPIQPKITDDNLGAMLGEFLNGINE